MPMLGSMACNGSTKPNVAEVNLTFKPKCTWVRLWNHVIINRKRAKKSCQSTESLVNCFCCFCTNVEKLSWRTNKTFCKRKVAVNGSLSVMISIYVASQVLLI